MLGFLITELLFYYFLETYYFYALVRILAYKSFTLCLASAETKAGEADAPTFAAQILREGNNKTINNKAARIVIGVQSRRKYKEDKCQNKRSCKFRDELQRHHKE